MRTFDVSDKVTIEDSIEIAIDNSLILDNITTFTRMHGKNIPNSNIMLNKYRTVLLNYTYRYTIPDEEFSKYIYRPKRLSNALYGTPDLWHMLIWINNMMSISDFNRKDIVVFEPSVLMALEKILHLERDNLTSVPLPTAIIPPVTIPIRR